MAEQYQYIVITSGSHTGAELDEFDTHAINYKKYARWNSTGTKYILRCYSTTPSCFQSHTRYTVDELHSNVLTNAEWASEQSFSTGSGETPEGTSLTEEQEKALDTP